MGPRFVLDGAVGQAIRRLEDGLRVAGRTLADLLARLIVVEDAHRNGVDLESRYYYGYATGGVSWTSTAWVAALSVPAGGFTDVHQVGVTRSGSDLVFADAGVYLVSMHFVITGDGSYLGYRLRDTTAGVTYGLQVGFGTTALSRSAPLTAVVSVTAGQTLTVQYCRKSGGTSTFNVSDPLDGETMRTGWLSVVRVG